MKAIWSSFALVILGFGVQAFASAADGPAAPKTEAAANAPAAAGSCESKAIDKNGKPLAGAAKASFLKKCEAQGAPAQSACEAKAVDKNGKKLAGAAKTSFLKKCEADAAAAEKK